MPWQSLLHCWVSKAGRLTFSLQNQATFKFRCLLVFVAYCDTGRGKGLALWPSLFTRHSVVVNLWNVCRDGFQREINFLIFFFVGCTRQRVFQPDLQETSRSSHCSEACLGPSCKMPDAGCGFSTRTVWHFLAMFPFFCLACCLIGIAPWHSGFAHWLWTCLRLCPDVLHSQELWAQILDPESCQQLATDTHFSCLIWPTCTWNATSCSWLCISTISTVESLNCFADILQAVCDRGHHALQLFPSISFHLLAGLTCLMPVSLTPSTALTDILMQLNWLLGDLCCSTFALHKRFWVRSDHGSDESYEEASFVETTQKETWQSCPEMFRSPCTLLFWNSILGFHRKSTGTLSLPDVLLPKLKKYKTLSKQRRLSWIDSGVSQ